MGRRQGGPSWTGGRGSISEPIRGRRPIFIATLWTGASRLFFRVARSTRLNHSAYLSQDRFNRPSGTGLFSHDPRHFVPGSQALRAWLLSCRSLRDENHSTIEAPRIKLAADPEVGLKGTQLARAPA
jgi:hypothetical protein